MNVAGGQNSIWEDSEGQYMSRLQTCFQGEMMLKGYESRILAAHDFFGKRILFIK
jgi:hypothetical protein